jgi:predicted Fe-Mo cluster-binding NifX family protein
MKIAFTSEGQNWDSKINPRFGRTEYFLIYDEESDQLEAFDNSEIRNQEHGAGPKAAKKLYELEANILITGNGPGDNAAEIVEKAQIKCFIEAGNYTVREAYDAYKNNQLKAF